MHGQYALQVYYSIRVLFIVNHIGSFLVVDNKSDSDSSANDEQLLAFFNTEKIDAPDTLVTQQRIQRRTRMNLAQRDTTTFAFVRLWTTLAELLAPIFAAFAAKKTSSHLIKNNIKSNKQPSNKQLPNKR